MDSVLPDTRELLEAGAIRERGRFLPPVTDRSTTPPGEQRRRSCVWKALSRRRCLRSFRPMRTERGIEDNTNICEQDMAPLDTAKEVAPRALVPLGGKVYCQG